MTMMSPPCLSDLIIGNLIQTEKRDKDYQQLVNMVQEGLPHHTDQLTESVPQFWKKEN